MEHSKQLNMVLILADRRADKSTREVVVAVVVNLGGSQQDLG